MPVITPPFISIRRLLRYFFLVIFIISPFLSVADTILMFVSHEDTYYSEYIVMKEALEASGYVVDVRSANSQDFSIYMLPAGTDIEATANTLSGSSYSEFQQQFAGMFQSDWNASLNSTPASLSVNGSILDITDITSYAGLIVVGGTGALAYRLDGDYAAQGSNDREISAEVVGQVAQRLNDLAVEALLAGKPVMAQCHGASLPVFWRVPDTSGPGVETLGFSLLKGGNATGFPETETPVTLSELGVNHRSEDRVTISSPHSSLDDNGLGDFRIVTTRDWYPQTVAYAARSFINILETYPSPLRQTSSLEVLIIHGGAVDETDCGASNRDNDIPCNYGGGDNLPADYTDLVTLLENNDPDDDFNISVSTTDITNVSLPFDKSSTASVLAYLEQFDVVFFYKHWSTGLTDEFLQGMVDYVDNGGGMVGLHHGLYNDVNSGQDKDVLISAFGAQSSQSGWSASLTNYNLHSTDYGHFISTYGVSYGNAAQEPASWSTNSLPFEANANFSYLPTLAIYDEIYNNMAFEAGVSFGRELNEITPLFSNDQSPAGQVHTSAFTKKVDLDFDGQVGRVFYIQVGERKENYEVGSQYYRLVRNATIWAAPQQVLDQPTTWNGSFWNNGEPTSSIDVVIASDYSGSGFECKNLEIELTRELNIQEGSLTVQGDLVNNGTLIVESGSQLITLGSVSGSDYQIERITTFDENTGRYSIMGSPLSSASFDVLGANAVIYGYDESEPYNPTGNEGLGRFKTPAQLSQTTMQLGKGYFSAFTGDVDGKVVFVGTPNTGAIDFNLSYTDQGDAAETDFQGFNLIANPYPAAIDADAFLTANSSAIDETLYLWDDNGSDTGRGDSGDYLVYNKTLGTTSTPPAGGASKWDGFIRSGQGFFVKTGAAGTVSFTDAMKGGAHANDDGGFYRLEPEIRYKLVLSDNTHEKATILGYIMDATTVHDGAYDAINLGGSGMSIYTREPGSNRKLTIQGLPAGFDEEIILGFQVSESGTYTLSLANLEEVINGCNLLDTYTQKEIDLAKGSYSFVSQEGVFEDRFKILSSETITGLRELQEMLLYSKDGHLHLMSNHLIKAGSEYQLIDLMGKTVVKGRFASNSEKQIIAVEEVSSSVYILRLNYDGELWSGKVIID